MKKATAFSAVSLAVAGSLSAQGLYNIMPYDDEPLDALPLQWVAGLTFGYDDNVSPTGSELPGATEQDATYGGAFVQANYANVQPQTTLDMWARVGVEYFFDSVSVGPGPGGSNDDVFYDTGVGLNVTHRVSERLRLRSRNDVTYQVEPDYNTGQGTDRRVGQYIRYSTDNSVGYSWTERFATVTGFRVSGVSFDDISGRDYLQMLFYNQFRYRLSPATVLTASYRYADNSNDSGTRDSNTHYLLAGAEHKFSPTTVGVLRGGVSIFDGTRSHTSPYVEGVLKVQTNEQLSFRGFIRYGVEDRGAVTYTNVIGPGPDFATYRSLYDERNTLRIGTQATYAVSPDLSLFGGVNVVLTNRDSFLSSTVTTSLGAPPAPAPPGSFDDQLYSINLGGSYRVMENVFLNGSYIHTTSSSDGLSREYDRNRFNLGVRTTF